MWRYLTSNSNLAGSAAALLVLILFFLGLIGNGWLLLTLGAYAGGALLPLAFTREPEVLHIADGLSTHEALEQLRKHMLPRLPLAPKQELQKILQTVDNLMPRLKEMEQQGAIEAQSRAMLKQTVTRLLPDAIETFLRLPKHYQNKEVMPGKTAQQLLVEQLQMLGEHVHSLEENLLSPDVNDLLVNTRYLQEKLQTGPKLFD
ncbi:hypothetical protein V8J88_17375 [Massilia sp. W12]|uniref:hypothetical protein n=1 Tax=Massilia sp. W12 TaxID=3126507 RepID=UPI0030CBEE52